MMFKESNMHLPVTLLMCLVGKGRTVEILYGSNLFWLVQGTVEYLAYAVSLLKKLIIIVFLRVKFLYLFGFCKKLEFRPFDRSGFV